MSRPRIELCLATFFFALAFSALLARPAFAATPAAALDPSFGSAGVVTTDLGGDLDAADDVAVQSDGRIVVGGDNGSGRGVVLRYLPNGQLDPGLSPGSHGISPVNAVASLPDGRIYIAGRSFSASTPGSDATRAALVRLLPNGQIDPSWNSGAISQAQFTPFNNAVNDIAIQPDGKVLTVGGDQNVIVARYLTNGHLDPSFAGDGYVQVERYGFQTGGAIALQADGKVIVGTTGQLGTAAVFRLTPNGNADGFPESVYGYSVGDGAVTGLAVDPQGRIIYSGYTDEAGAFVHRLEANGAEDYWFDMNAGDELPMPSGAGMEMDASGVALEPDGRIVTVGSADNNFAMARLLSSGEPDPSLFGGAISTDLGGAAGANAVAVQGDGRIIAAGYAGGNVALARYLPDFSSLQAKVIGPKRGKTGKPLRLKIKVINSGGKAAEGVRVCLKTSKKVRRSIRAKGKACRSIGLLSSGATRAAVFRLRPPTGRKGVSVSFLISHGGTSAPDARVRVSLTSRGWSWSEA